jgi:hypothetical protein
VAKGPPDIEEIRRNALNRIRELRKKTGAKPDTLAPGGNPELWPGGPSVWTQDILLARRAVRRSRQRRGYA